MPISTSHFHFVVWAAVGRTENGYTDVTYVDVIADTEAQAVSQCPRGHSLILTMAQDIIKPIFLTEADRLLFLSRLWKTALSVQDVMDWESYKLVLPKKLVTETESEYSERFRLWHEGRVLRRTHYILSKYEGYALGKVKPEAEKYLATRPNPNRTQAREAVKLQLEDKWAAEIMGTNVPNDLLLLIQGLVW